jgi:UDP-glucose 4-epimerase
VARYLITGGAGFIGSHLAASLLRDGHRVRILDNLFSGHADNIPPGVELRRADIVHQKRVRKALEGVDGCFHLAAIASVAYCHENWLRSHEVNLGGTVTVFEEAVRAQRICNRVIPVVYASSAAVYGSASNVPISERTATAPTSAYGVDKLGCEMHAAVAAAVHGLVSVGLRFFNVYGPRQDPHSPYSGVVSIFCSQIAEGAPVCLHGDGTQVRDFVYVADAVLALRRAMEVAGPQAQVFNVCTGVGIQVRELGKAVARLCDTAFAPRGAPARVGDVHVSIGNPTKARQELGFQAQVPLRHGLKSTLAWLRRSP